MRDIPGYMERMGSGIRLMLNETRKMGLPSPQFREVGEFVVTFRKVPVGSGEQAGIPPKDDGVQQLKFDTPSMMEVSRVPGRDDLPRSEQRMMIALRHIQEHGTITSREYGELAGISESTALRDLEAWVERGVLRRIGKRRGRRYELV
jgi:ATP-dependent DNA helicase RecG